MTNKAADKAIDDTEFEHEMAELQRISALMPKIIVGVFLAVAVIMVAVALVSTAGARRALAREVSVPG
jgi:hypothetical protein